MSTFPLRWSWGWTPFVVIGAAAIANTVMIMTSAQVRPQQVARNAYLDSQSFDAEKAARERLARAGLSLDVAVTPAQATLAFAGGSPAGPLSVQVYRPSDSGLDQRVTWADPQTPLTLPLAAGPWRLDVRSAGGPEAIAAQAQVTIPAH